MTSPPPAGSRIAVLTTDTGEPLIVIPAVTSSNFTRNARAIVSIVWLAIVTMVLFTNSLLVWYEPEGLGGPFGIVVRFAVPIAAGIGAAYVLYLSLRPAVPETLKLAWDGIDFDSGVQRPWMSPMPMSSRERHGHRWSDYYPKRIRCRLDREELKSLRQTRYGLAVDVGRSGVEFGRWATKAERDWLFRVLMKRYGLKTEVQSRRTS